MSKTATLIDQKTGTKQRDIEYDTLKIKVQQPEGKPPKDYVVFTLNQREDKNSLNYPLDKIALKDEYEQIIGNQAASKIFTIDNKDDRERLKNVLTNYGTPPEGVRIGGKRKRKTRKSKRPRKSKKSKRKTNRKKI